MRLKPSDSNEPPASGESPPVFSATMLLVICAFPTFQMPPPPETLPWSRRGIRCDGAGCNHQIASIVDPRSYSAAVGEQRIGSMTAGPPSAVFPVIVQFCNDAMAPSAVPQGTPVARSTRSAMEAEPPGDKIALQRAANELNRTLRRIVDPSANCVKADVGRRRRRRSRCTPSVSGLSRSGFHRPLGPRDN